MVNLDWRSRNCSTLLSEAMIIPSPAVSVGTSASQIIREWREQFHAARVGESLDPFNPGVASARKLAPQQALSLAYRLRC